MAILDTKVTIDKQTDDFGRFIVEPLEKGYGHTLGNALRRVLLSTMHGTAIRQIKFDGATHEFTVIPGVKEDVVELILNIKKIIFKLERKQPTIVTIDVKGPGVITAGDFHCPAGVSIVNKDHEIANLSDKNAHLKAELLVEYGKGYHLVEEKKDEVGVIYLDANFSPVERVNYRVEATRVGKLTDLDKLIIEIFTDGSVEPEKALEQAAAQLVGLFELISGGVDAEELPNEEKIEKKEAPKQEKVIYLEELDLPTRVLNTLRRAGLENADDVLQKGEEGLLEIKNVGPKIEVSVLEKARKAVAERNEID